MSKIINLRLKIFRANFENGAKSFVKSNFEKKNIRSKRSKIVQGFFIREGKSEDASIFFSPY